MLLLPDPADRRRSRRAFALALGLSLAAHVIIAGVYLLTHRAAAQFVAHLLPRPSPTPEDAALATRITVEKRPAPQPPPARPQPPPRPEIIPRTVSIPVPTLAPLPTAQPTTVPTPVPTAPPAHAFRATIHRATPAPSAAPQMPQRSSPSLTPQQLADLQSQISRTIADTRTGPLSSVRDPAAGGAKRKTDLVMKGTPSDVMHAQGICKDRAPKLVAGGFVFHYLTCTIHYADGYEERDAVMPWRFRFPRDNDPIPAGTPFGQQPPPSDYQLPPDFEPSRVVCVYFKHECAARLGAQGQN